MSFLIKRGGRAFSGWRDLDAEHARPDENPIKPPWKRTNPNRSVVLTNNEVRIAAGTDTIFQMTGVSYEQMALTNNWGVEFDLNIDGNIIQQQFFAAVISSSWARVGFTDLIGLPMVCVFRNAASAVNSFRVLLMPDAATIQTLASTADYSGLQNRTWYRLKILISLDHLVRVFYNDTMLLQYWLPNALAAGPNRRALNFINSTSAVSQQRNFRLGDYAPDYQILRPSQWAEIFADDFNRPDGAVGNGWTQFGVNAEIRSGSWTTIGTTNGNRAILRDTGNSNGVQRVEATLGGFIAPSTVSASLLLRTNSDGTSGLLASFNNNRISISRFTSSIAGSPIDGTVYVFTEDVGALANNTPVAFAANGSAAWVEVDGVVVLLAQVSTAVVGSYMGAHVQRNSSNSGSWNSIRLMEAAL